MVGGDKILDLLVYLSSAVYYLKSRSQNIAPPNVAV